VPDHHAVTTVLGKEQRPADPDHRGQLNKIHAKMTPETHSPKTESIELGKIVTLANIMMRRCVGLVALPVGFAKHECLQVLSCHMISRNLMACKTQKIG
jgi:hypothetical protein